MKALFLVLVFCVPFIGVSAEKEVLIHRRNKGWFGYKHIAETHTSDLDRLECHNPGFKRCEWNNINDIPISTTTLNYYLGQVESAIDSGQSSGSITWGTVTAAWSGELEGDIVIYFSFDEE